MKIRVLIALLFLPMLAVATGSKDTPANKAEQAQAQSQDQYQGQYQVQQASAAASQSQGNEQSVTFVSPDDITVRNTAAARPPSVYPTGSCRSGWSAGVGLPGFNVAGGGAPLDENCDARETARLFYEFGEREKAIMILCLQPAAADLPGCRPSQDYVREMKLLELDNAEILKSNQELREQLTTESAKCEAAKDKIIAGTCGGK